MTYSSTTHRSVALYWCPKCKRYFADTNDVIHEINEHLE